MDKVILAIVGLAGSGKTEASQYLMRRTNWPNVHFGHTVTNEVKARGLETNQTNERVVREEFRARHGMGALAIMNLPRIRELFQQGSVIIESFYSWEEYTTLKSEFGDLFKVLAVYANFEVRAARMVHRPLRPLSRDELNDRDYTQIETLHQAGPIARADYLIVNEDTQQELYDQVDTVLTKLNFGG